MNGAMKFNERIQNSNLFKLKFLNFYNALAAYDIKTKVCMN